MIRHAMRDWRVIEKLRSCLEKRHYFFSLFGSTPLLLLEFSSLKAMGKVRFVGDLDVALKICQIELVLLWYIKRKDLESQSEQHRYLHTWKKLGILVSWLPRFFPKKGA